MSKLDPEVREVREYLNRARSSIMGANENEGNLDPSRIGEYAGKWIDLNSED